MYLVIAKGTFNDSYENNATWIELSIQDTFINATIEGSGWSTRENVLLSNKPLKSSDTLLNRYSDIIIFQERERVDIHPSENF